MLYFRLIRKNVDTSAIRQELMAHDDAWLVETGRQARAPAQKDTNAIPLRGLRRSAICGRRRRDVHESRYTGMSARFPETVRLIESLAAELGGELGRAKLAQVPPGKKVLPHVDRGEYYRLHNRHHLVIRSEKGSPLQAGDEEVRMQEEELWWFDNSALHAAQNDSTANRVHLIFDVLPRERMTKENTQGSKNGLPQKDPVSLLQSIQTEPPRSELESVAAAATVYLAARNQPKRWAELLVEHHLLERAENHPLATVISLCYPKIRGDSRQRYESALGWCLAQLDLNRVKPNGFSAALAGSGGIDTIHAQWNANRDRFLYGKS